MFFRKKSKYEMDKDTANAALQNILAACDKAPNTIPFDKLLLRQEANTKPYKRWIYITGLFMLLTFATPLVIVPLSTQLNELTAPEPVRLTDDYVENGILYLQFSGDDICYHESYIEYVDGTRVIPCVVNEKQQLLGFPFGELEEINIYIIQKNGEAVHYLLTPYTMH